MNEGKLSRDTLRHLETGDGRPSFWWLFAFSCSMLTRHTLSHSTSVALTAINPPDIADTLQTASGSARSGCHIFIDMTRGTHHLRFLFSSCLSPTRICLFLFHVISPVSRRFVLFPCLPSHVSRLSMRAFLCQVQSLSRGGSRERERSARLRRAKSGVASLLGKACRCSFYFLTGVECSPLSLAIKRLWYP